MKKPTEVLKMNWNRMHIQSRQDICLGAMISEKLAAEPWEKLEPWIQMHLADSMERRSRGKVQLGGEEKINRQEN